MSDNPFEFNVGAFVTPKNCNGYLEVANGSRMVAIDPTGTYRIDEKNMKPSGVHIRVSKKEEDGSFTPVLATLLLDSFQPAEQ